MLLLLWPAPRCAPPPSTGASGCSQAAAASCRAPSLRTTPLLCPAAARGARWALSWSAGPAARHHRLGPPATTRPCCLCLQGWICRAISPRRSRSSNRYRQFAGAQPRSPRSRCSPRTSQQERQWRSISSKPTRRRDRRHHPCRTRLLCSLTAPRSPTPWYEQVWMPSLSEQRRSDPGGLGWTWSRAAGLGPMAKLDDELLRSVLCWTDLRTRCAAHSASKVPPNMCPKRLPFAPSVGRPSTADQWVPCPQPCRRRSTFWRSAN